MYIPEYAMSTPSGRISWGLVKLIPSIRSPIFGWSGVDVRIAPKGAYAVPSSWYQLDGADAGLALGHGV